MSAPKFGDENLIRAFRRGGRSFKNRHEEMQATYNSKPGKKCGDCAHFKRYGDRYFKCLKYANTASSATDWRSGWEACGLWKCEK